MHTISNQFRQVTVELREIREKLQLLNLSKN